MRRHWYHFTGRMRPPFRPLLPVQRHLCVELWRGLRTLHPDNCLAAVLMPNHFHLLVHSARPDHHRRELACFLRGFTRRHYPGRALWEPLPKVAPVGDLQKLELQIRYIHLNPCRARMTLDPWSHEFSTLWDHTLPVVTAEPVLAPWVHPANLERWLGVNRENWAARHRAFCQMDSTVSLKSDPGERDSIPGIDADRLLRVLTRATGRSPQECLARGRTKDLLVRIDGALNRERLSLQDLSSLYGMRRQRVSQLLKQELPRGVVELLELHARRMDGGSAVTPVAARDLAESRGSKGPSGGQNRGPVAASSCEPRL